LQNALGSIPTDVAQYDPRFKNALNNALAQRAGGCGAGSGGASATQTKKDPAAVDGSPKPPPAEAAGRLTAPTNLASGHGFPVALAVLAALVAAIVAGTAIVAYTRGREPGYAGRSRVFSAFSDYYWGIRDTIGR
jgi:hypothetical protein